MEGVPKTIRHDWYQGEAFVVVNILVKNMTPENVQISLQEDKLCCILRIDGVEEQLAFQLAHAVKDISWKLLASKIEIKLKKIDFVQWSSLEKENKCETPIKVVKKDWDKMASEIKKQEEAEQLDGEAALNQMFQKIYADGSDETRKAMNKSYMESGGTVLSTNWREVGDKKIDMKAPDGMEWKKWND